MAWMTQTVSLCLNTRAAEYSPSFGYVKWNSFNNDCSEPPPGGNSASIGIKTFLVETKDYCQYTGDKTQYRYTVSLNVSYNWLPST